MQVSCDVTDLTVQRQADERLRRVYHALAGGVLVLDPQWRVVEANATAEELLSVPLAAMRGQVLSSSVWEGTRLDGVPFSDEERPAQVALRTGQPVRGVPIRVLRPDGATRYLQVDAVPLCDEAGAVEHVVVSYVDLTARAQTEEHFRSLLEALPDAIIVRDAQSLITFWNHGAEHLYGWSAAEAVGHLTHRLLRTRFPVSPADVDACLQRDGFWSGELVHTTRDGRQVVVESHQALRRNAGGRPVTILEINADITERKRGEEVRAQLAAIVEASEDAIIGKTLDGTITSWNPAAARLYGYSAAEAIGQSVSLLYPPDHRDELPELLARVARGESVRQFETERLRKDGTRVAVSVSIAPVRTASGTVVAASVVARDITERRRAEAALCKSEARAGAILDATPDACVIVDGQGRIARVNAATERLFGYGREELLGQPVELLLPERFRARHVGHRADYSAQPQTRPMGLGLELAGCRRDSSEFPAEISLSAVRVEDEPLVSSTIRDRKSVV